MNEDRRRFLRVASRDMDCQITIGDTTYPCLLVDESIEGLRIGDIPLEHLKLNQAVTVMLDGEIVRGFARGLKRKADGSNHFEIGILRETTSREIEGEQKLLGHFLKLQRCSIHCHILESLDEERFRILMADGKVFTIPKERVMHRTEHERRAELKDQVEFTEIKKLYKALVPSGRLRTVDDLIAFEFKLLPTEGDSVTTSQGEASLI